MKSIGEQARIYSWETDEVSEIGIVVNNPDVSSDIEGSLGVQLPNGEILWEGDRQCIVDIDYKAER